MALGRLGKYDRVDVLGHGASGIVYLAWDTLLKKQVALKEIDVQAADVNRFLEEARVVDRLSHPNIVRINGVDMIDGHVVIDMEYVKGLNLQELLRSEGTLPLDRSLDIAIQTLDALDYAHQMRTVHRDIKPANILIDRDEQVKLVDFGLAEILATNSYAGGAGTYAYMAPEDFDEERHSDHQSDIWAVGVTLYEMISGERPFKVEKAKDPFAWRRALQTEAPAPIAVEDSLQAVIERALARDKRQRYATAGQFRDDLRAVRQRQAPANATIPITPQAPSTQPPPAESITPVVAAGSSLPGVTVATVETIPPTKRGLLGLGRNRAIAPITIKTDPPYLHFGSLRMGDQSTTKLHVRVDGGVGKTTGRIVSAPDWAAVFPSVFTHRKQSLTVTARSERVWEIGDYGDDLVIEVEGTQTRIPLAMRVSQARRPFAQVALWFVPLYLAVLMPALTVGWGVQQGGPRYHIPAAVLASALLSAMLTLVALEADLGVLEKIACMFNTGVMALLLGVSVGMAHNLGSANSFGVLPAVALPIGFLFILQTTSRRYWKFWSAGIGIMALMCSAAFSGVI